MKPHEIETIMPGILGRKIGLDHGIGHLASMSPQNNERLLPSKG